MNEKESDKYTTADHFKSNKVASMNPVTFEHLGTKSSKVKILVELKRNDKGTQRDFMAAGPR